MTAPRSLADDLRARDDESLAALLRRRPDLVHPVPSDITALTTRATTGPSVSRCLDNMDAMHLHVLHIVAELTVLETASDAEILAAAAPGVDSEEATDCAAALADLVDCALVWGGPDARRSVHAARGLVASAPQPTWPRPTLVVDVQHDPDDVDVQAALHAREALAHVRDLLDDWSAHPPAILRSGGLSLRDFAAARRRLQSDWSRTALTIELAHAARLTADDHEDPPHWVPTEQFDVWLGEHTSEQWTDLVVAWLSLPRLASNADQKTQVLTAERDRRAIPVLRRQVLDLLAAAPAGASLTADNILAVLDDRQPRRTGELRTLTVHATLREAGELGLLGAGALSTAGRLLLDLPSGPPAARHAQEQLVQAALRHAMPEDVDHVLIQADLTVVAPGPLISHVARTLRLVADVESRGHATVYRISEESIRRALDAGWDAASIHTLLDDISRTSIPQPLSYLIDDVARRHGTVRVGNALGYLRSDNADTLTTVLNDRRLRALGLSRIADTVLISQAAASELIDALRNAGYAPAAESPDGQVLIRRPEDRRTRAPRSPSAITRKPPEDALITAAVRSLRAGDHARSDRRGPTTLGPAGSPDLPSLSSAAIVTRLRSAIADNLPVWIGYADTDGAMTQQIVDPIRVAAGVLTAFDHRVEQVRSFAVSRVTGVADLAPDEVDA